MKRLPFAKPLSSPKAPRAFNSTLPQASRPIARSTTKIRKVNPIAKARREKAFKKFLGSSVWRAIRAETFRLANYECAKCPYVDDSRTGIGLVCDHLTYARFGGQEIVGEDTRALCQRCNRTETVSKRANWVHPHRSMK